MTSRIEELIDEIEEYIDRCKPKPFSNGMYILVNKEEMDDYLRNLRQKCPEEIKRYQKIISNKEAILNDAKERAQGLIDRATAQTTQLINEHEIMQQAYEQANEIVTMATKQAQDIVDKGVMEANQVREAAIQYMDEMLANLDNMLAHALDTSNQKHDEYMENVNKKHDEYVKNIMQYHEIVKKNRASLHPIEEELGEEGAESSEEERIAETNE